MAVDIENIIPDRMFDGGDLDCGSGLILMIRDNMLKAPARGILEMRSREPTVSNDLPPWCRMSGHEFLGKIEAGGYTRYFVRKGSGVRAERAIRKNLGAPAFEPSVIRRSFPDLLPDFFPDRNRGRGINTRDQAACL